MKLFKSIVLICCASVQSAVNFSKVERTDCPLTGVQITDAFSSFAKSKFKKVGMKGSSTYKMKYMAPDKIKNTVDYTGIVLFWRKHCGTDFLNGFMDGRLSFDVLDHGNYYTPEHGVYRDDKSQSNVALQFRHAGEPVEGYGKKDKTTGKRVDLYYLTIRGLDKIDFGSKDKDACLLGGFPGFIKDGKHYEGLTVGDNFATCAAFVKDLKLGTKLG